MAGSSPTRQRAGTRQSAASQRPQLDPLTGRYARRSAPVATIESTPLDGSRRLALIGATVVLLVVIAAVVSIANAVTASRPEGVPAPAWSGPLFPCPTAKSGPLPNSLPRPDYPALVVWNWHDYEATDRHGNPSYRLGEVTCDVAAIAQKAEAFIPRPWPNGSSTAAGVGAAVYAQRGSDPDCEITVELPSGWFVFRSKEC